MRKLYIDGVDSQAYPDVDRSGVSYDGTLEVIKTNKYLSGSDGSSASVATGEGSLLALDQRIVTTYNVGGVTQTFMATIRPTHPFYWYTGYFLYTGGTGYTVKAGKADIQLASIGGTTLYTLPISMEVYDIALVCSASGIKLYVNKILAITQTFTPSYVSAKEFYINGAGGSSWEGAISDVVYIDKELTDIEVAYYTDNKEKVFGHFNTNDTYTDTNIAQAKTDGIFLCDMAGKTDTYTNYVDNTTYVMGPTLWTSAVPLNGLTTGSQALKFENLASGLRGRYYDNDIIGDGVAEIKVPLALTTPAVASQVFSMVENEVSPVFTLTGGTSFEVIGLPTWVVESGANGETLTATPAGIVEHGLYSVIVDGGTVADFTLRISSVDTVVDTVTEFTASLDDPDVFVSNRVPTITNTTPTQIRNSDGSSSVAFPYYTGYGADMEIHIYDTRTGLIETVTDKTDDATFGSSIFHLVNPLPITLSKSYYVTAVPGVGVNIHSYDTDTHTWDFNLTTMNTECVANDSGLKYTVGTNGNVYVVADSSDGLTNSIMEYNVTTGVTSYIFDLPRTGPAHSIVADNTHIYYRTNVYAASDIYSIPIGGTAVDVVTLLPASTLVLNQSRLGATIINNTSVSYYLYNGAAIISTDPIPWNGGVDTNDLFVTMYQIDKPTPFEETNILALRPRPTTGYYYYKVNVIDAWTTVAIPNITTTTGIINDIKVLNDGNLFVSGSAYCGYAIVDVNTGEQTVLDPIHGALSNYVGYYDDVANKMYTSGYFGADTYEFDLNNPFDAILGGIFDPDTNYDDLNPKASGDIGNPYNVNKSYAMSKYNNKLYITGEKLRSGEGAGVIIYDFDTKAIDGISDIPELADHGARSIEAFANYFVTGSYPSELVSVVPTNKLLVFDYTKTLLRTIVIPDAVSSLMAMTQDDGFIYYVTNNDSDSAMHSYKIDPSNGSTIWDQSYTGITLESGDIEIRGGFLVVSAGVGTDHGIWYIDMTNGNIHTSFRTTNAITTFSSTATEIYFDSYQNDGVGVTVSKLVYIGGAKDITTLAYNECVDTIYYNSSTFSYLPSLDIYNDASRIAILDVGIYQDAIPSLTGNLEMSEVSQISRVGVTERTLYEIYDGVIR